MKFSLFILLILSILPLLVLGGRDCECSSDETRDKAKAFPLKLAAIFSILAAGAIGVCLPVGGKWLPALSPERDLFFIIKAFAAGVILATAFVHIFPDAYQSLTSPCLPESPWGDFPFSGFVAMVAGIVTLMVDTFATGYYSRVQASKASPVVDDDDEEKNSPEQIANGHGHGHGTNGHGHGTNGHAHGHATGAAHREDLIRHRVISQVLELGILVHSVIIGISLGASQNPSAIKPLVAALSFHQFFEGMSLGGSIVQAEHKVCAMTTMIIFFSLTNPIGIAIGIGISSVYDENSPIALIVQGLLNSTSAGILIYMALVDLLAADFMNPRVQSKGKLQLGMNISLLVGVGLMSLLAKWA